MDQNPITMKTLLTFIPERDTFSRVEKLSNQLKNQPKSWNVSPRAKFELPPSSLNFYKTVKTVKSTANSPNLFGSWKRWRTQIQQSARTFYKYLIGEINDWYKHPPLMKATPTLLLFIVFTILLVVYQWLTNGTL